MCWSRFGNPTTMALLRGARSKPRTTYQLPLLLRVTPRRGTPRREDHDEETILLVGKSPASTSLLVGWSPHRDLPSSLFLFSSFATPQVRHSLLASFVSHLRRSTHKRCGSTYYPYYNRYRRSLLSVRTGRLGYWHRGTWYGTRQVAYSRYQQIPTPE
jgi:hypothetical protein